MVYVDLRLPRISCMMSQYGGLSYEECYTEKVLVLVTFLGM